MNLSRTQRLKAQDSASAGPRRIAVLAYSEFVNDIRIRNETEALAEAGYLVDVIAALPKAGPSAYHFERVRLHEVGLGVRRGSRGRYLYQYLLFVAMSAALLTRLHAKHRFDFVHVHTLPDFLVFSALPLKLSGTRIVMDLHEAMPEILSARFHISEKSLSFRLATLIEVASCRFADRLIAASDGIRDAVASKGVPPERFYVVYNSGDRRVDGTPPSELRERFQIPRGRYLVHAGSINPERDLETLLRAFASLGTQDLYLIVAGEGERSYMEELAVLAEQLGIEHRVFFTGNLPVGDARSLMSLSEIGLVTLERNPLTQLAWPMRIVEFANMGKQLVVPNLGFIRHVLGDTVHYYEPGNPASLAAAIGSLLTSPPSENAPTLQPWQVCSRFGWDKMRPILLSAFQSAS